MNEEIKSLVVFRIYCTCKIIIVRKDLVNKRSALSFWQSTCKSSELEINQINFQSTTYEKVRVPMLRVTNTPLLLHNRKLIDNLQHVQKLQKHLMVKGKKMGRIISHCVIM